MVYQKIIKSNDDMVLVGVGVTDTLAFIVGATRSNASWKAARWALEEASAIRLAATRPYQDESEKLISTRVAETLKGKLRRIQEVDNG